MSSAAPGASLGFFRFAEIVGRIVVPAAAGLTLASILVGRGWTVEHDLHLVAPLRAESGERIPVRALLYAGLRRPQGPHLQPAALTVSWVGEGGQPVRLQEGFRQTMEGSIQVPVDARGVLHLQAVAQVGEARASAEREVQIGATEPRVPQPRELGALSRLAHGPVSAHDPSSPPPDRLQLRVAGGACVPEHPCILYVHVGEPAASVHLEPTPSVTPSLSASHATSSVVRLSVITHGPEALLSLVARRDGRDVARRRVRLPVALGMAAARPSDKPRILHGSQLAIGRPRDEPGGCIADLFAGGRWRGSQTLPACRGAESVELGELRGLLRLQLRTDPFGAASATVRTLYRRSPGEKDAEVLGALAQHARARDPADVLARTVASDAAGVSPLDAAAVRGYLMALLDEGLLHPPRSVSGHPAAMAALEARRDRVRGMALWVLSLCGLLLILLLSLRGLRASAEAGEIMEAAGEQPAALGRQRLRRGLRLAAMAVSLLLAFTAIAMYVIARASGP